MPPSVVENEKLRYLSLPGAIAAVLGLVLPAFSLKYYTNTIVHWSLAYAIWLFTGLAVTLILSIFQRKTPIPSLAFRLIVNCFGWGGIAVFSFIMINFYGPTGQETLMKLPIHKLGYIPPRKSNCGHYYAEVAIGKLDQDIHFSCCTEPKGAKFILVTMRKGFWGLNIVTKTAALLK